MSKRAVIYTRVSQDHTGEGASNARQEEACRKLADLRGWEVVGVEPDISISAYSGKERPGWERVLGQVERGEVDVVIAWHVDRMTRSMLELERLILLAEVHGVGVATVTGDIDLTTDVGRMVARILAAVARAEVERKSARQRLANTQRASEGKPWPSGIRAFGYTLQGELVEPEAALIRQAATDVLDGKPLGQVAREWTAAGFAPDRGKAGKFTARSVRSVLLNPRYAGLATRGEWEKGPDGKRTRVVRVVGVGQWEPVYDETTHTMLSAHLRDPSRLMRANGHKGRKAENLLTGIAVCARCEATVRTRTDGVKARGTSRKVYSCSASHLNVDRDATDALVRGAFVATVATVQAGSVMSLEGHGRPASERDALLAEDRRLEDQLGILAASLTRPETDMEATTKAIAELRASRGAIAAQLEASDREDRTPWALRADALDGFEDADLDGQRAILQAHTKVTLRPAERRGQPLRERVRLQVRQSYPDGSETWLDAL